MYDKSNMLRVLESFSEQLKDAEKIVGKTKVSGKFNNIIICGMGGSGIGGDLIKPFVKKIPVYVNKDYDLPNFIDKNSMVFVVSYSGNTEETLNAYNEAKKRRCKVIAITSGGRLSEKEKNAIIIPAGLQPREALSYTFLPILMVLSNSKIISNQNSAVNESIRLLVPKTLRREGFLLAQKIKGKIPVFYASETFKAAAYRCKTQVNENAKQPAFSNVIPEMNHNELSGFKNLANKVHVIFIRDKKDSVHIRKRIEINKRIIKEKTGISEINTKGKTLLARMLTVIYVGDFASYYLALMNKEDPTPVSVIEELKKRLK